MERAEFEAAAQRDGFAVRNSEIAPDTHRPPHVHPFDARLFILDGTLTLVCGGQRQSFTAGGVCEVPAGTLHEEHTGGDGVRYLAGRRALPA